MLTKLHVLNYGYDGAIMHRKALDVEKERSFQAGSPPSLKNVERLRANTLSNKVP